MYDDSRRNSGKKPTNTPKKSSHASTPRSRVNSSANTDYGMYHGSQQMRRPKGSVNSSANRQRTNSYTNRSKASSNQNKIKNINRSAKYNDGFSINSERTKRAPAQKPVINKNVKPVSPKKRKIIHIITYCLIFLVILAIGIVLSLTVLFRTENITVDGDTRYATEDIVSASGLTLGENIFLADKNSASSAVVKKFPYVEKADVNFRIPNVLNIAITEAHPSYLISNNKHYLVISAQGRILEKTTNKTDGIPLLIGPKLTSEKEGSYVKFEDGSVFTILMDIVNCVEENKFERLTAIDITNTAKIKLVYDNRITILLGFPEDIDYKIRTAMTIIDEKLDPNHIGTLKGELDVSNCNTTKKSYFNEETIDIKTEATGDGYDGTPDSEDNSDE